MRWFSAGAWRCADTGLGQWTPALLPSRKSPSKPPGSFSHGFSACKGRLPAEPGHEGLLPAACKPQKHKSDGKTLVSETVAAAAKSLQSCTTLCNPIDGRNFRPAKKGRKEEKAWEEKAVEPNTQPLQRSVRPGSRPQPLQTAGPRSRTVPWMSWDSACVRRHRRPGARAAPKSCLPGFEEKTTQKAGAEPQEEQKEGEQRRRPPRPRQELREQPSRKKQGRMWRQKPKGNLRPLMSRNSWQPPARRPRRPGWSGCGTWTRARSGISGGKAVKRRSAAPNACSWRPRGARCTWAKRGGEDAARPGRAEAGHCLDEAKKGWILSWSRPAWREGQAARPRPPTTPALTQAESGHLPRFPLPLVERAQAARVKAPSHLGEG